MIWGTAAWTRDDPGVGETEPLRRVASALRRRAQDTDAVWHLLDNAASLSGPVWGGDAGDRLRDRAWAERCRVVQGDQAIRDAARLIDNYCDVVEDVKSRQRLHDIEGLLSEATRRNVVCRIASSDPYRVFDCVPLHGLHVAEVSIAEHYARTIEEDLNLATRTIHQLADLRQEAEDTLRAGLSSTIPAGWAATRRAFIEAGVWNPAQMTPHQYAYLKASEVNRALSSGKALPPETIEYLRTAPPEFWEVFFQYCPPERALEYGCTMIATQETTGDAETFGVLSRAVARHAAALPPDQQTELGRALALEAERYWDRGSSAILASMLSEEGMPVRVNAGAAVELDRMPARGRVGDGTRT